MDQSPLMVDYPPNIICIENNYGRKIIQNIKEGIFQKEIY